MQHQVTEEQLVQLQELLGQGRKLQAVKLYREFTGESLAVSKAAVESIETENTSPNKIQQDDAGLYHTNVSKDVFVQVERLMNQGKKIDAIKFYREATGESLSQAKEFVEDMGRMDTPSRDSVGAGPNAEQQDSGAANVTVRKGCAAPVVLLFAVGFTLLLRCL